MEFRTNNRPRSTPPATPKLAAAETKPPIAAMSPLRTTRKWLFIATAALIVVAAVVIGIFMFKNMTNTDTESAIKRDGYQAVFLTNNQVYFGRLTQIDKSYLTMTHVYYLQVQQPLQQQENETNQQQPQQASLSKLGSEVHGPEDTMYISRDQVLFWENLKDDSKVVQAIKEQ